MSDKNHMHATFDYMEPWSPFKATHPKWQRARKPCVKKKITEEQINKLFVKIQKENSNV